MGVWGGSLRPKSRQSGILADARLPPPLLRGLSEGDLEWRFPPSQGHVSLSKRCLRVHLRPIPVAPPRLVEVPLGMPGTLALIRARVPPKGPFWTLVDGRRARRLLCGNYARSRSGINAMIKPGFVGCLLPPGQPGRPGFWRSLSASAVSRACWAPLKVV